MTPPGAPATATEVRPGGEDGMTLIELLVAMFVVSILLAGVATVFTGTLRGVSTTNTKTSTAADLRVAMEAMTRTVKVTTRPVGQSGAFVSASSTGMSFYSLLNRTGTDSTTEPVSTLVTYAYDGDADCLYETRSPGVRIVPAPAVAPYFTWTVQTATQRKCLLRTSSPPTFLYYGSGSLTATALPSGSGVSATDLLTIRSVEIRLVATDPANTGVTGIPGTTRITLENLIGTGS